MSARPSRPTTPIENHANGPCSSLPATRPTLCDVLCDRSPSPWSLSAFTHFLSRNFCAEVLCFTAAVITYRNAYARLEPSPYGSPERGAIIRKLFTLWRNILETYIAPNSPSEINIPGATRNALLAYSDAENPPSPDILQSSYNLMYDLMGGIFVQFMESVDPEDRDESCCGDEISHPCATYRSTMAMSTEHLPPHRRAHGLWGGTRVYRKIISRRGKESPSPSPAGKEDNREGHLKLSSVWG